MSEIFIIGLGAQGPTTEQMGLLQNSCLIVSGARLAAKVAGLSLPIHPITPPADAITAISGGLRTGNVAVLASGDPLFFGIAARLLDHFGRQRVRISPAISSMQEACALFKIPWDDAALVSLHGREALHPAGLLLSHAKTLVFTDTRNSPDSIARGLCTYLQNIGADQLLKLCRLLVAENIGSDKQRLISGSLAEIAGQQFAALNVLCLLRPEFPERPAFGLHEDEIAHSRGLITKDEVRAATLHRLRLPRTGVFWDIGGGSGSISIEAASMNPRLTIYTVERKAEEIDNIKTNIRRFACFNIIPVAGTAAETLAGLPDPDAVFVGGSGGELPFIIAETAARMTASARLVINAVTDKTLAAAPRLMRENGLSVTMTSMTTTRTGAAGPERFNPITMMVGQK